MTQPRAKKTALACDQCRRRKRKCDGRTPVCTACECGNIECVYTTLEQRRPPPKNYVKALEARVTILEKILRDSETTNAHESSSEASSVPNIPPRQSSKATPDSFPIGIPQTDPISVLTVDAADILQSTLGPMIQLDTSAELDLGMEGYDTLLSLECEHKLLAQFWDWQRMHHPYVAPVPFLSSYAIHSEVVHPDESIPPPPPPLLKSFAVTALNVPRASDVQRTSDLSQYISPLLLYSMFAIAALFHGDAETGEMFYECGKRMVFMEAANPKVATVQAMCLMATWELGHARSSAAWTLTGVALSLCIRLGMNVDSTPLLQAGAISQRLFETRNFVFWSVFNSDRFLSTCMGMRPLIDRRIISASKHSSPIADSLLPRKLASCPKNTTQELYTTWWSPYQLGMGDVLIQATWDAVRGLVQMTEELFDRVYATHAPTRTPEDILELVAQNHLTIQKFIEDLPTWLRSTGAIRRKENGLVYVHLFIHLTSILTNRPFFSSHHPLSNTTRKYRTLAFRIARASALQISSLIRHIPLSSPCVTIPYIVYSACTVLLLAPEDSAAMDGVRTGLACLDGMDETGYWVESAKDATRRIRALAARWGVELGTSRRVLGLAGGGIKRAQSSPSGESEPSSATPTRPNTSAGSGNPHIATIIPETSPLDTNGSVVPVYDDPSAGLDGIILSGNIDMMIDWTTQSVQPTHGPNNGTIMNAPGQPTHSPAEQMRNLLHDSLSIQESGSCLSTQYRPSLQPTTYPFKSNPSKRQLPHVAYATGHADPEHDMHLPHSHWHSIIQPTFPTDPTNPSLIFPPDPSACADLGACFGYTVEHGLDPAFVDQVGDPYASVAIDWAKDIGASFPRFGGGGVPTLFEGLEEQFGLGGEFFGSQMGVDF